MALDFCALEPCSAEREGKDSLSQKKDKVLLTNQDLSSFICNGLIVNNNWLLFWWLYIVPHFWGPL